jgi:hypothetical protein
MMLGLVRPDEGTATINGTAYRDLQDSLRQVGAVLEASSFHPGRTAQSHRRDRRRVLGGAAFGPAHGASTGAVPLPFAAVTALLAAVAILIAVAAARTTVARDVT